MNGLATEKREPIRTLPAYYWTFGDLMTLLLSFFILLQAFARERNQLAVEQASQSFIETIDAFGLPGLMTGSKDPIDKKSTSQKHAALTDTQTPDEAPEEPEVEAELSPPDTAVKLDASEPIQRLVFSVAFSNGELAEEGKRQIVEQANVLSQLSRTILVVRYYGEKTEKIEPGMFDEWATKAAQVARYMIERCHLPFDRVRCAGCPPQPSKAGIVELVLIPEAQIG